MSIGLLIIGGLYLGCNSSSSRGGSTSGPISTRGTTSNPAPTLNSLTSSKTSVGLNESWTITAQATDSDPVTYDLTQLSGPIATITSGTTPGTFNLTSPGSGSDDTMVFKMTVSDTGTGQTFQSITVNFDPPPATDQHNLEFLVKDDPAGDTVEAILTRKDGTPVTPSTKRIDLTYNLTLTNGESHPVSISVESASNFKAETGFGRNNAGQEIKVSDLQSISVTVTEGSFVQTKSLDFAVGNPSVSTNLSLR